MPEILTYLLVKTYHDIRNVDYAFSVTDIFSVISTKDLPTLMVEPKVPTLPFLHILEKILLINSFSLQLVCLFSEYLY